jgi:hypothetical protein
MHFKLFESLRARSDRSLRSLAAAMVAGLMGFSIYCGYVGIDFGPHWDEGLQIVGVRNCVDRLMLLPSIYNYGSIYVLVGLAVLIAHHLGFLPSFLHEMRELHDEAVSNIDGYQSVKEFQRSARALLDSPRFILETRMVFFGLSSLTTLWVYLILRKLYPGRYLGALAAAAFLACSWEFQYHSRFIAVDALLAMIVAAELLLLVHCWLAPTRRAFLLWYLAAAAGAGLAFTCKAPGLVALLAVVAVPFILPSESALARRIGLAVLATAVAVAVAVMLQPSLVIDPLRNLTVLARIAEEYAKTVSEHPNTTSGLVDRVGSFLAWLWLAVPSPCLWISLIFSAIVLFGLGCFVPSHRRLSLLGGVIVVPLLLMMVRLPLMIVRNHLLVIPMLAIGFGLGLKTLHDRLGPRVLARWPLLLATVGLFLLNERWLLATALEIRDLSAERIPQAAAVDLLLRPEPVRLSPRVFDQLAPRLSGSFQCRQGGAADGSHPDAAILLQPEDHRWRSNVFGLCRRFYGPQAVNYDWYSTWISGVGRAPIMLISARQAHAQDLQLARYGVCDPVR